MAGRRAGLRLSPLLISANWRRWVLTRRLSVCPRWPTWNPSISSPPRSFPPSNRSRLLGDKEPDHEAPQNKQSSSRAHARARERKPFMDAKQKAQETIHAYQQTLIDLSHRIHDHPE